LGQFDRYTHSDLEALGEMMLEGRKHLDEYSKLTEFKDGSLNSIVEDLFGDGDADGAGSREQQIEKLARGDYW
jgi:DnaJ-class molecular chaperone